MFLITRSFLKVYLGNNLRYVIVNSIDSIRKLIKSSYNIKNL